MMLRTLGIVGAVLTSLLLTACVPTPPTPPPPRPGTAVNASFSKAWDATIDQFAERTIQIKTLDRSSGLIIAESQPVGASFRTELADCGTVNHQPIMATAATWNVLVRGDSTRTTVKATVRFVPALSSGLCYSRGVWETEFEDLIRARAEGTALRADLSLKEDRDYKLSESYDVAGRHIVTATLRLDSAVATPTCIAKVQVAAMSWSVQHITGKGPDALLLVGYTGMGSLDIRRDSSIAVVMADTTVRFPAEGRGRRHRLSSGEADEEQSYRLDSAGLARVVHADSARIYVSGERGGCSFPVTTQNRDRLRAFAAKEFGWH
jgi:hypothetical protein